MSELFYAASTSGFYDTAIHGNNIPKDAMKISVVQHIALLEGQASGKMIIADKDGYPVLQDPSAPSADVIWSRIKAKRDAIESGGVKVGEKWFHTDDASRIQHMALNMMGANIPANLQWKTMDGSFVTMTQALAGQAVQAVATLDMNAFAVAEQHRVAMEASTDPAAYDYSDGWPAVYGEQL